MLYVSCTTADAGDVQRALTNELETADVDVFIAADNEIQLDQWRLDLMESATVIGLWIDSPSEDALLELGLAVTTRKLIAGCRPQSAHRTLVETTCARYDVPLVDDAKVFASHLRERLHGSR